LDEKLLHQHLVFSSFINSQAMIMWVIVIYWKFKYFYSGFSRLCPNESCQTIFEILDENTKLIQCSCGWEICFDCGKSSHEPATCKLLEKWEQEVRMSTEYRGQMHTKYCPECSEVGFAENPYTDLFEYFLCRNCGCQICWYGLEPFDICHICEARKLWKIYLDQFTVIENR
jgi:hypothetical protein